jgi:serine/threonine protein kinase
MENPHAGLRVGAYILEEVHSHDGGMAEIWRARHVKFGVPAIAKTLRAEWAQNGELRGRFFEEGRVMYSLHHEHIVAAKEFETIDGRDYLVLEFLAGGSLADRIQQRAGVAFSFAEAVSMIRGVLKALDYAHSKPPTTQTGAPNPDDPRPIFHRDIKPENILFDEQGRAKLTDFGIAHITSTASGGNRRVTGFVQGMGTQGYMSPEQAMDARAVDHRSDLYSVGVVLFEMLTGQLPGPDTGIDARRWNPNLTSAQVGVVSRALQFEAEKRFQSASEMLHALEAAASSPAPGASSSRSPILLAAAGFLSVALICAIGLLAAWALRSPSRPEPRYALDSAAVQAVNSAGALAPFTVGKFQSLRINAGGAEPNLQPGHRIAIEIKDPDDQVRATTQLIPVLAANGRFSLYGPIAAPSEGFTSGNWKVALSFNNRVLHEVPVRIAAADPVVVTPPPVQPVVEVRTPARKEPVRPRNPSISTSQECPQGLDSTGCRVYRDYCDKALFSSSECVAFARKISACVRQGGTVASCIEGRQ